MTEKINRFELQKLVAADIKAAIKKAEEHFGLDPKDVDAQRRFFRALVTLASQQLFDMGAPSQLIATQAFEAIVHEHQFRHKQAAFHGMPFGPAPTAKA